MFTIGVEFSIAKLLRIKKTVLGGGGVQVTLTIGLSAIAVYLVTGHINTAVFTGFLVALSSTAIVFLRADESCGKIVLIIFPAILLC